MAAAEAALLEDAIDLGLAPEGTTVSLDRNANRGDGSWPAHAFARYTTPGLPTEFGVIIGDPAMTTGYCNTLQHSQTKGSWDYCRPDEGNGRGLDPYDYENLAARHGDIYA